ncbi:MAG: Thiol-disulfide oxidoreductase ResA [Pelotomaculum sp. PtaB.Bin104]|nr:MAG: Thiol-disulfide oxidoreductase ResA [Pelotomaculum sp. PtaB.Bin104]
MHKLVTRILVLVVFIFILVGCSGNKNQETNQISGQPGAAEQAPVNQQDAQQAPGTGADAQAANQQQTAVQQQASPTGQTGATVPVPAPEQAQAAPKASGNDAGNKASAPAVSKTYSLSVGGYFPPFNLAGLDGNQYSSANVFSANKVTLINCWATFCGPCIREMPDLEKLRQNYQGQGLGVIGIVLDANKAQQAKTMAARLGTGYPHLLDDGRYGQYIYAVPQTYLIDSEGKIVQAVTGASNLQYFSGLVEPYLK